MATATPTDVRPDGPSGSGGTFFALALLGILFLQGLSFIIESSQTSDEAAHLLAGYTYLTTGDFRMNREEPPLLKELAALPLLLLPLERPVGDPEQGMGAFRLGPAFVHENRVSDDTILLLGRLPILGLSLLLGWAIFRWGRRIVGTKGALLSLALYVLDPNVVAHSCLVTTDLGVTLFIFLTVGVLRCWAARPSPLSLVAAGLSLGAAFASKSTAFWIEPVLFVLGAALLLSGAPLPKRPWAGRPPGELGGDAWRARLGSLILAAAILASVAFLVVLCTYGVRGLPEYFAGIRRGVAHSASGHPAYLLGDVSERGWWYYFLFAFLVKTPPGTLLILALAGASTLRGPRLPPGDEIVLWVPVLVVIAITCLWRVNIGLRHLLPIYPFLFLAAGRLVSVRRRPGTGHPGRGALLLRGIVMGGLAWTAVDAARIAPHQLAYFNELVGGPGNGHLYLLDSNLDWGQSSKALRRYVAAENVPAVYCAFTGSSDPGYYGVRYQYVPGIGNFEEAARNTLLIPDHSRRELLAVSAMALHFVRLGPGTLYDWLRERPVVATPGYSYLVYDITGDAGAHARLAHLYFESHLPVLAAAEARRALGLDPGNVGARAIMERLASP